MEALRDRTVLWRLCRVYPNYRSRGWGGDATLAA
jgi:hypothetical protein